MVEEVLVAEVVLLIEVLQKLAMGEGEAPVASVDDEVLVASVEGEVHMASVERVVLDFGFVFEVLAVESSSEALKVEMAVRLKNE